jgi:NitT/TauT family transport system substrate-binding protein
MHSLGHPDDWDQAMGPDGALEALVEAKQQGLVRAIGVTGHGWTIAAMHRRSLARFDFDSILLPYNFFMMQNERYRQAFEEVATICRERGTAVQTIKAIARGPWAAADRSPRLVPSPSAPGGHRPRGPLGGGPARRLPEHRGRPRPAPEGPRRGEPLHPPSLRRGDDRPARRHPDVVAVRTADLTPRGDQRSMRKAAIVLAVLVLWAPAAALAQTTKLRVAICARTISMGVGSPFAVAMKMGWFKQEGLDIEIVPLPGSTDCVKAVATGEVPISLPSVEPLANGRPQGVRAKIYYTAYQTNGYGIAVPAESPIQSPSELRGKSIGVTSLASAGVVVARAQVAAAGLDPARDVQIVVAGEGAQTAAMVRNKQVEALSQFDTQYAMVENAGVRMRYLDRRDIEKFPGNGFLTSEETLRTRRKELIGMARAYAKGTIFTIANPEAAVRIVYEVFPQTKPTGKDEATAVREDVKVLEARMPHYKLEPAGVKRWGENSEVNYRDYVDFLVKWSVITQKVPTSDLITNDLIEDINRMDAGKIAAEAAAYRYSR